MCMLKMKATNSITQVHIDDNYTSNGGINGYGTSIAPALNVTYYFKNNLGGLCLKPGFSFNF